MTFQLKYPYIRGQIHKILANWLHYDEIRRHSVGHVRIICNNCRHRILMFDKRLTLCCGASGQSSGIGASSRWALFTSWDINVDIISHRTSHSIERRFRLRSQMSMIGWTMPFIASTFVPLHRNRSDYSMSVGRSVSSVRPNVNTFTHSHQSGGTSATRDDVNADTGFRHIKHINNMVSVTHD